VRAPVELETQESDVYPGARPPRFAPALIGHARAEAEMLEAYRSGRLAHAWLISGPEGVGKATLAWRFARFVLCFGDPTARAVAEARDLSAPENHPAARQLAALAHPDFALIRRAWNSKSKAFFTEIRVDDVREGQNVFRLASAFGGWRVLLVDAADDLNRAGANALLKTIEEPPSRALILIVAHRPARLPPTIRSRCRRLALDPLSSAEVETIVRGQGAPWSDLPDAAVERAVAASEGSVREALRRLDPEAQGVGSLIETVIGKLPAIDWRAALKLADGFAGAAGAENHERFLLAFYDWIAARARATAEPPRLEAITELWGKVRQTARDVEALNIDRKTHTLACLQEVAERARRL
jgi:DNA polymerase III subunit delta'